jgi:lipoate---protein ligase
VIPWRLIPFLAAPGPVQMAIDAWLLEQHRQGLHPPTLRFCTWSPPGISLGYHQHRWPEAWNRLVWEGQPLQLVRRPSGGRAVLHQGDLIYAVVCSGLRGSRSHIYRQISEFLRRGWADLGVPLDYGQGGRGYIHHPDCFGTATGADLVLADGFKLIGSAQLWRGDAVLQHGSIRLQPDPELLGQVFGKGEPSPLPAYSPEAVIAALINAAEGCFAADLHTQPLSPAEWEAVSAYSVAGSTDC